MVINGLKDNVNYLVLLVLSLKVDDDYKITVVNELIQTLKNLEELDILI